MEPCTQYCHIVSLSLPGGPETLSLVGELRSYPERSDERLKDGKGIIGETQAEKVPDCGLWIYNSYSYSENETQTNGLEQWADYSDQIQAMEYEIRNQNIEREDSEKTRNSNCVTHSKKIYLSGSSAPRYQMTGKTCTRHKKRKQ